MGEPLKLRLLLQLPFSSSLPSHTRNQKLINFRTSLQIIANKFYQIVSQHFFRAHLCHEKELLIRNQGFRRMCFRKLFWNSLIFIAFQLTEFFNKGFLL